MPKKPPKKEKDHEQEWCICKKNPCFDKDCDCPLHYATKKEWLESKKSQPPKQEDWGKELMHKLDYIKQAGFELGDFETEDMLFTFIINLLAKEREKGYEQAYKEMTITTQIDEKEIRQLIAKEREEAHLKGFIEGADATGSQMNELKIEEVKQIRQEERERFAGEIEGEIKELFDAIKGEAKYISITRILELINKLKK